LDYFGARYFSAAQGRFSTPDPKLVTSRHLLSPQKWNKYSYVQNNPLANIDPDGLDDYKIFIADPAAGNGDWARAKAAAEANGHTFKVFGPKSATIDAYNKALADSKARVIFVGHTTHDPQSGKTTAVVLSDGRSAGENSVIRQVGPTNADGVASMSEAALPTTKIAANSVGLFGCSSAELSSQYSGGNFVGVDSGPDRVSSLNALGPAAAAFVAADAAARPSSGKSATNGPNSIDAANQALQSRRRKEDLDGDRVLQR